jgi:hypothetical protein
MHELLLLGRGIVMDVRVPLLLRARSLVVAQC